MDATVRNISLHSQDEFGFDPFDKRVFFKTENLEMSSFNRIAIKCILHECLDQLYILRNINTQDKSNFFIKSMEYISIADRYMGSENHADYRINSVINNYEKLARDIHCAIHIISESLYEMDLAGHFTTLIEATDAIRRMREDEKKLLIEKQNNDKFIEEVRKQCEEERLKNIKTIEDTNSRIQKLRFEVDDLQVYTKYELNYFTNWENTRREQNTLMCQKKEKYLKNIIESVRTKIDSENRCHMELENYVEESKNDYLDAIQYWMKYYDEEIEKREADMITLKANMEKLGEDHLALQQKYDSHKAEIEDWLEYKRKKKEKEELEALQIWAAVKIQAWWRGTMYRKKLGPYSKKKKKGKDKGKGKDKKGKRK